MNDNELIELVARVWVENGGDADGIAWSWRKIQEAVAALKAAGVKT